MNKKVEFIESYIKIGNADYQWSDNHGELIRCKDCKAFEDGKCYNRLVHPIKRDEEWFCADGERRPNLNESNYQS